MYGIPIWFVIRIAWLIFKQRRHKNLHLSKESLIKEAVFNLFIVYLIGVAGLVFLPVVFLLGGSFMNNPVTINVIPFEGFFYTIQHGDIMALAVNIIWNLLLLAPLILFIKLLWVKAIKNYKQACLLALAVSFFIEFIQFLEDKYAPPFNRAVDITDLILNSLGGLIGFVAYKIVFERLKFNIVFERVPGE